MSKWETKEETSDGALLKPEPRLAKGALGVRIAGKATKSAVTKKTIRLITGVLMSVKSIVQTIRRKKIKAHKTDRSREGGRSVLYTPFCYTVYERKNKGRRCFKFAVFLFLSKSI
ncbi:MAG: hypothetical protein IKX66_02340 [Clostridia bacterium]|nr:hypothetical protein [Clostridia bacterium]